MDETTDEAFAELYRLRDENNKLFVRAWKELHRLSPEFFETYQRAISQNDAKITKLMNALCD